MILKNKKLTKIGGSFGFIIEKAYIKNKQIFPEKEYDLEIKEVKSNENKQTESNTSKGTSSISNQ